MRHLYFFIIIIATCCACSPQPPRMAQIDAEEKAGNFTIASRMIDAYIAENRLTEDSIYILNGRKDRMRRIIMDFTDDRESVMQYIRKYYPDVNGEMLLRWESDQTLEYMVIDGEKKYFDRGASNLFRLDRDAAARKQEIDKPGVSRKEEVLRTHLPQVVAALGKSGKTQDTPVDMKVKYTLTLQPNAVPDGETVRCWLPYPREDNRRQTGVRLLSVNAGNYVVSPHQYAHRTLYMEKTAKKDEPLVFACEFSYRSAAEWFDLQSKETAPYDTGSALYRACTAERPPHIVFSDSIRAISQRILGGETRPYEKLKRLFTWVDEAFPWAGAREYSTLDNIPEYVLSTRHGDCGQVTLLLITLARYNGIPARWQSGFMMHPNSANMHDWSEFYIEGAGWIPMDESFGVNLFSDDDKIRYFYSNGIDAYRWIVNSDYAQPLFPAKIYPRSDNIDFQRGELEWKGGNIYYDRWKWNLEVTYQ
ncbi:MAG: transglutaminase domain-containing protein [Bacteroidales bacterium]|jgi:transglutaminase-like putative cysteine protease|nr:transglutaminase domain-containing protein [Bacteroidales bacterium]